MTRCTQLKPALLLSLLVLVSPLGHAFNLGDLKALGDKLQKSLPAQEKNSSSASEQSPSVTRTSTETRKSDGRNRTVCESEKWGFNTSTLKTFSVGDAEALVKKYFSIDSVTAESQLRSYLFENRNPVTGTSLPEALLDGGIISGEARARGVELLKDPSIANLAQVIAASEQKAEGFGTPKLQVMESKTVFALVALQLEPLLKNKNLINKLLKDARKKGSVAGFSKPVISPVTYALSARYSLIEENNGQKFDNFLAQSRQTTSDGSGSDWAALSAFKGGCQMCQNTQRWAAQVGLGGGKYAQQIAQGEKMIADMNQGKLPFNSASWANAYEKTALEAARLDELVRDSFVQAKTQSQAQSAGAEARRRSEEAQRKYGMIENPMVKNATSILAIDTPRIADEAKKQALTEALKLRYRLLDQTDKLHAPLAAAFLSGDYDIRDVGQKSIDVFKLTQSQCLVAAAQERAAKASDTKLPDPKDNAAETDFMRMD